MLLSNFINKFGLIVAILFGVILNVSCGQSTTKLLGKYQADKNDSGIEFVSKDNAVLRGKNNVILKGYGDDGTAITYKILQDEDGSRIKFFSDSLEPEIFAFKQDENHLYLSQGRNTIFLRRVDEFTFLRSPPKNRFAIANLNSINRGQQAFFLEEHQFTDNLDRLRLEIKSETGSYQYSLRKPVHTDNLVFNIANPKHPMFKGYIGLVQYDSEIESTVTRLCEANSNEVDVSQLVLKHESFECPEGMNKIIFP
jgi:hypothetical protein